MSGDVRAEVVRDAAGLTPDVLAAWRDLAVAAGLPYATPGWMLAFLEHFHLPEASLLAVLVFDGPRLVGVGPWVGPSEDGGPLGPSGYGCLASGMGQRSGPLAAPGREPEVAQALAAELARASPRPAAVVLDAIDARSPWPRLLADAWPGRRRPWIRTSGTEPGPIVELDAGGDAEAWLAGRSSSFREQVRRRGRGIARRGGRVRLAETPAQVESDLRALWRLHHERFAAQGRISTFEDWLLRCVTAGCLALFETGAVRLWCVEAADGEVVGAQLCLHAGERVCLYNSGTSMGWEHESVGFVLMARAVADAHGLGARLVDLGAGAFAYKLRFANADEPIAWRRVVVPSRAGVVGEVRAAPRDLERGARLLAQRLPAERRDQLRGVVRRVRRRR